jgi:hypothetical protein
MTKKKIGARVVVIGLAPILSAGQRTEAHATTLLGVGCRVSRCANKHPKRIKISARSTTRGPPTSVSMSVLIVLCMCGDKKEREWSALGIHERSMGPASSCAICCSRDGWPWASSSAPAYEFHVYVSYVWSGCCICFIWMFHILQWLYTYVTSVSSKCFTYFIWMLYVFIWMLCMLQLLYPYVASVCFKCFSCFRSMLQIFYLNVADVAVTIPICCTSMFQIF